MSDEGFFSSGANSLIKCYGNCLEIGGEDMAVEIERHLDDTSLLSRLKLHYARPVNLISLVLIACLIYVIVVPVGYMLSSSLKWQTGDVRLSPVAQPGQFTLFHWERVLASPLSSAMFYEPLRNTMVVAIGTSILALLIGLTLAWLLERTDLPGRKWFGWFAPLPYMMPSWYIALAWIVFFKNDRIGGSRAEPAVLCGACRLSH